MTEKQKHHLLTAARAQVRLIQKYVESRLPEAEAALQRLQKELRAARSLDEQILKRELAHIFGNNLEGLNHVFSSPYFSRCDILSKSESQAQTLYFGKFSLPEQSIYSWVSPISQIRFESPGSVAYRNEEKKEMRAQLTRKDQYLINKGRLLFMSTEAADQPRQLVYQEYFSGRKAEFALPEIVERMEKAQDAVIRADYRGPFLISGPAGSGKTTLALHRIAYLLQSPEISDKFDAKTIVVFVQDASTQQYFQQLLPSLGIHEVLITTFADWSLQVLKLSDAGFSVRYGGDEIQKDRYEFAKNKALRALTGPGGADGLASLPAQQFFGGNPFGFLGNIYGEYLRDDLRLLFDRQTAENMLDRFDMTILLAAKIRQDGALLTDRRIYEERVGRARSKIVPTPLTYSLIMLDEIQNYLPAQVQVMRALLQPGTQALTYAGDLAQQTSLGTLRSWNEVGERFAPGRIVELEKVYRSTRQILEYLRAAGFSVEIPAGVREGDTVAEFISVPEESAAYVEKVLNDNKDVTVGIIGITPESVAGCKHFEASQNVRVLPVSEAQGVEFDTVILVGVGAGLLDFMKAADYAPELLLEKKRILRDQLYVALTRAMNRLHVLAEMPVAEIVRELGPGTGLS